MAIKQYFAVLAGGAMLSALLLVTIGVIGNRHASGPSALFAIGEPLSTEEEYMTLHPVYTRCAKKADVAAFTKEILVKCGDINELTYCSWTCTQALQTYSDSVGCCWESVLQGYEALDANAGQAWRNWQGTASGKCGVTFAEESCGDSVGEHTYNELQNSVKELSVQANQNSQIVNALEGALFGYGRGSYKQNKGSISMAQPAKIGGISVDETIDFPPEGKRIVNGDISVPVEKIEPPLYFAHRAAGSSAAFPPSQAGAKKGRETQLYNAYDDFRNYQNSLRLKAGYDSRFKGLKAAGVQPSPIDGRLGGFPVPGEAWQD